MRLKAMAKINLGLDVLGKREDGYHEVRMIMQTIRMYDILDIIHTDGLHDHAYLMITVLSLSQNIKSEIDFCHCF